jgi:hypothetical protein
MLIYQLSVDAKKTHTRATEAPWTAKTQGVHAKATRPQAMRKMGTKKTKHEKQQIGS